MADIHNGEGRERRQHRQTRQELTAAANPAGLRRQIKTAAVIAAAVAVNTHTREGRREATAGPRPEIDKGDE